MSNEDCKFCNRSGLPLLPLRLSYLPEARPSLPDAIAAGPHVPAKPTQGALGLRVITEGYVYIYDTRAGGFWRCFGATPDGHFRECALEAMPSDVPKYQCSQQGHAAVASVVSIGHAKQAAEAWVGYSRVWWTKGVRGKLKADSALRAECMVKVPAAAIVTGGAVPADIGQRVGDGAALSALCAEYAKNQSAWDAVNAQYARSTTSAAQARYGQADALVHRMQAISPGNAIVLALPDTVGLAQDLRHWANLKAGALANYQADATKLRSRIVGDLILGIEKSMTAQGHGDVWAERYASKLNMAGLRADKQHHDAKVKSFEASIVSAGKQWCAWANSSLFKRIWQTYDGADSGDGRACGAALERAFCHCVFGAGGTREEQAWWKQWLTSDPADSNHALWLALAAGDKDVVAYMKGDAAKPLDVGKSDKGVDVIKNTRELAVKIKEWLERRKSSGLVRAVQSESGMLAYAAAVQLQNLARGGGAAAEQALVAGQRLRVVVASRMDVLVTPHAQQVSLQQMVVQMHEAVWGPPKAGLSQTVREARALKIAQGVDGAWLGSRFSSSRVVTTEIWLPDPALQLGATPAPRAFPGQAQTLLLPRPAYNYWEGLTRYLKQSKTASGILGLGAALQVANLSANLIQLDRALGGNAANRDDAVTESLYGVVSGTLGLLGVTGEFFAGTVAARVSPAVVTGAASRLLAVAGWTALGGGMLGAGSAVVDALQAWKKQVGLQSEGDLDAASSYGAVRYAAVAAAVGSGALAVIGAGSLLTAAGATGAAAGSVIGAASFLGMGAAIPVVGWIVLVIGATAAGIYFAWKASTEEDTPLEKWLSRCCWRSATYSRTTRKPYPNLKLEMADFQQALYGLSVTLYWNDRWGKDEVEVSVSMPGYSSKASEYAFLLELGGRRWKRTVVTRKTSAFSSDIDLRPQPPVQATISAPKPGARMIPMEEVLEFSEPFSFKLQGGVAIFAGKVRVNEDYFDAAKLKFEYWPDAVNQPELKMQPVPGGANYFEAKD